MTNEQYNESCLFLPTKSITLSLSIHDITVIKAQNESVECKKEETVAYF
jgi:hypothetical protein